jgi:hypothetical protein
MLGASWEAESLGHRDDPLELMTWEEAKKKGLD